LVDQDGHEFLTEDIPRDLDWFMIMEDDYESTHETDLDNRDEDNGFLPYPAGIVEIIVLAAIVAAIRRPDNHEL